MVPPLASDRGQIVAAKIDKLRLRIALAQTTLTVHRAIFDAANDAEIHESAAVSLRRYGESRLEKLRAWKKTAVS